MLPRLRRDFRARADFLETFDDNLFANGETAFDDPAIACGFAKFDLAEFQRPVLLDDIEPGLAGCAALI